MIARPERPSGRGVADELMNSRRNFLRQKSNTY